MQLSPPQRTRGRGCLLTRASVRTRSTAAAEAGAKMRSAVSPDGNFRLRSLESATERLGQVLAHLAHRVGASPWSITL